MNLNISFEKKGDVIIRTVLHKELVASYHEGKNKLRVTRRNGERTHNVGIEVDANHAIDSSADFCHHRFGNLGDCVGSYPGLPCSGIC
jgi:hypothetical protein